MFFFPENERTLNFSAIATRVEYKSWITKMSSSHLVRYYRPLSSAKLLNNLCSNTARNFGRSDRNFDEWQLSVRSNYCFAGANNYHCALKTF